jgi:hypothetical protein
MSTAEAPNVNSKPVRPVVIRPNPFSEFGEGGGDRLVKRQIPAVAISVFLHLIIGAGVIVASSIFGFNTMDAKPNEDTVLETKVDEPEEKKIETENTDVGLDPNQLTNYNIDRIEEISVPGPLKPDEAVGTGADTGTPMTIPPPPGFGGSEGQGGTIDTPTGTAASVLGAAPGGMGGPPIRPGAGFPGRSGATRKKMLSEGGGSTASEAAVARGLIWLQKVQNSDGSWEFDGSHKSKIGATGLALLPFLAAGHTHKPSSEAPDPKRDPDIKKRNYHLTVRKGIEFLLGKLQPTGNFGTSNMYEHAIAAMSLCEAYGMSADPKLRPAAQNVTNFIIKAQHSAGGWRYSPGQAGDTSVTGWQIQALKSAHLSGLSVPQDVLKRATGFLDSVAYGDGSPASIGSRYGYTEKSGSMSMTAVGLLCRQYLGWGPKNPKLAAGVEVLKRQPPSKGNFDIYYLYYATQVVHFFGGDDWSVFWNPKIRDLLIDTQVTAGQNLGSWNPTQDHTGTSGGRIATTCLCLLTLEVYYRHLPLYKRDSGGLKDLES